MIYNYKIHVLNRDINFDISNKNVVQFFNPLNNTKDYTGVFTSEELTFNEYYDETATDIINFDAGDGVNASVVLDLTGENVESQFLTNENALTIQQALNRQYCIIDEIIYNDEMIKQSSKLYFYFIVGYSLRNANTIKYNLKIDAFTTYPLFSDIAVDKTKILRAHTDRFTYNSTLNNANLNLLLKYLQTGEPIDTEFTKIKIEEIEKNFKNICAPTITKLATSDTLPYASGILENILNQTCWLYLFKHKAEGGGALSNKLIFAPFINNTDSRINDIKYYVSVDNDPQNFKNIDANILYENFSDDPYIYNAFISPLGPFGSYDGQENEIYYNYDSANNRIDIIFKNTNVRNYQTLNKDIIKTKTYTYDNTEAIGGIYFSIGNNLNSYISYFETDDLKAFDANELYLYNIPFNLEIIDKAEAKTKIRQCYNEYTLKTDIDTSTLSLDLSILKTNTIKLKAINNISCFTNGEIYFTANELYNKDLGIFTKAQYTPLMYGDKFKEYKATNNNYQITGQAIPIITGALGGAVAGAKFGGVYGAVAGAFVGLGSASLKVYSNFDNMKNSPNSIKLKGQQIAIDNKVKKHFFNLEHNSLREADKIQANLYFYKFGYNISEIENISNYFTRSSFNYIQLENCEKDIHALINKNVLDIVIKALNDGVCFWTKEHYINSKFNYDTNNLEKKLLQ